jgi:2-methylcitrate dehydratase PrpD
MAQGPIELLRELMEKHRFAGSDIAEMTIVAVPKVLSHHNERRPADIMLAQYSVPVSVAIAAYRDPEDPGSFADGALRDRRILDLAARIAIVAGEVQGFGARMSIKLHDGRNPSGSIESFRGCPETPQTMDDLVMKFGKLTRHGGSGRPEALLAALLDIENVADVATLEL